MKTGEFFEPLFLLETITPSGSYTDKKTLKRPDEAITITSALENCYLLQINKPLKLECATTKIIPNKKRILNSIGV